MKLKVVEGCVCDSITVDEVESIDMNIEDFKKAIHKLIDSETDLGTLQECFRNCVYSQGVYEVLGYCEQCGDHITKYTLEV